MPVKLLTILCLLASVHRVCAEVGDVTIQTDHEQYPGEGAFQSPAQCVNWAARDATTDHEKSLAIFQWLLTHQWHLMSPQEWCIPGRVPGANSNDYEMVVYDANKGRFSYGYGLCGTVHAWNEVYWQAAGFPARRRAFPGHTNSEIFYDGKWRMYDTDMAGIVFNRDGSVAGYDEITSDLSLLERPQGSWPRYPFAWPSDFETMKRGWEQVAQGGNWYKLYHGGYAALPGIVHLRSGETFTRYAHPDGFGGRDKRRFWHQLKDGPNRDWTFANGGVPFHRGPESNSRGRTTYGNALFEYAPDLTSEKSFEGSVARSLNLAVSEKGLRGTDDKFSTITFHHFSPYVICGDPPDDRDPLLNRATEGFVVEGVCTGDVTISVSADQGQSWAEPIAIENEFRQDLTELAKGRYGWWIRFSLGPGASLKSLRTTTTCQLNQAMYPRLKPVETKVTFRSQPRAVVPVLPRLEEESATLNRFEVRELRTDNLDFVGRSSDERLSYRVRGPNTAEVVFRVPAETPLVGISAAARFAVRSPTPEGAEYQLEYSVDCGQSWQDLGTAIPPADNEFSSGWVYGQRVFPETTEKDVLVKVRLFGGGYGTGLLTAELYGIRATSPSSASQVTYSWFEGDTRKEYSFDVPANREEFSVKIPTGRQIRDDFVRIAIP